MARRSFTKQTNFASGELTDSLDGRTDLDRYYNGAKTMLNWQPIVQGGVRRAVGTTYIADMSGKTRLFALEAAEDAQFLIAIHPNFLSIFKDDVLIQTIPTPWAESIIFDLDTTQALDTVIITVEEHPPYRLYRDSLNNFYLENLMDTLNEIHITHIPTEPLLKRWYPSEYHFEGEYIKPSLSEENGKYYICTDEGLSGSSAPTWSTTDGGSTTDGTVTWETVGDISDIELWSPTRGYPRTCVFHDDRLLLGGSSDYPHRVWASKAGDYFDFDLGTALATDGIDRAILADELPIIQWMFSGRRLMFGALKAEFAVIQDNPITPGEMNIIRQTGIGSCRVSPIEADGALLHLTRNRAQVRELLYNDGEAAFGTRSMSLLSPLAVVDAIQIASQTAIEADDANLVYVVNAAGYVGILNTLRDQDFLAWVRRSFQGSAESIVSLGNTIYAVVSYEFGPGVFEEGVFESGVFEETGASSNRYLCKFDNDATLDFQKTVTVGTPATSWTGFDHLADQTVKGIGDGIYLGDIEVDGSGNATTNEEYSVLTLGVNFPTPTLELMPVSFDSNRGNISHLLKRLVRGLIQLSNTTALVMDGDEINFINADDDVSSEIGPYTGILDISSLGWDRKATIVFTAPEPLPVTILSVTREVAY